MEYKGKLYGKIGKKYFGTGKTSEDWDKLEADLSTHKIALGAKASVDINKDVAFLFAEFCAKYYLRMEKVWCHKYNNQLEVSNHLTTEQLYIQFMGIRNNLIYSLQSNVPIKKDMNKCTNCIHYPDGARCEMCSNYKHFEPIIP